MTVDFVHRAEIDSLKDSFKVGTFYWIDKIDKQEGGSSELWFGSSNGLIRLDNHFDKSELNEIVLELQSLEGDVKNIQEILGGIDLNDFLTSSDLEEINDKIDKVNDKLTWKVI